MISKMHLSAFWTQKNNQCQHDLKSEFSILDSQNSHNLQWNLSQLKLWGELICYVMLITIFFLDIIFVF